ncbi:MAG: hypothetical protein AB1589_13915 [Cyanobacteriota bacterium]
MNRFITCTPKSRSREVMRSHSSKEDYATQVVPAIPERMQSAARGTNSGDSAL